MTVRSGLGIPAGGNAYLLASSADRDRAVDVLKAGYAEGRLSKGEYDSRASQALAARTLGDLARVTADLPGGHLAQPVWPVAAAPARTNPLAIASLVCGIGQPFTGMLSTIPAIVLGHMARREIRRTGEDGTGLATVGLVLGWTGFAVLVVACLFIVVIVSAIARG
jgi:Domain of unknown function (DUF4190)/Domain of unknown function (DUF1707)